MEMKSSLENENLPCAESSPEREDHLAFPTLIDIVAAMERDDFEPQITDNPAFSKLKQLAFSEREHGTVPGGEELESLITDLEPQNYNSPSGNLQCARAFKSLKYIAERTKRMQKNEDNPTP